MQFNVAQLLKGQTGGQRRYELREKIVDLDPDLVPVAPLTGTVTLMRTSQGILATGTLRTAVQVTCRRCLDETTAEVELELEEEFHPLVHLSDVPLDDISEEDWDEALYIDEHHSLDLREVIRQGLWLAVPVDSLCRSDCAGLCPVCGGNRNLGECECGDSVIDPRWAALQALLHEESEPSERSE
jgi:uncharacterized protein